MTNELFHQVALTIIPDLGPVRARLLLEHCGSASAVFRARKKELSVIEGIGDFCARIVKEFRGFDTVERELRFIEQQGVVPLFITEAQYPRRLLHCYDPPVMLYYRGGADLNTMHVLSVIGTRNNSDYGKQVTEELIASLVPLQVLVVSGLAFGIDSIAHRAALQQGLATVGVLGHGLDTIYPSQNRAVAREMALRGGLLTEFRQGTQPDRHNFPRRNRIVAGMSDATLVVETACKGGSMITAELACTYNRDLFAVPGRLNDHKSSGCLQLIRQNKAMVYTSPADLLDTLGWQEKKLQPRKQAALFHDLNAAEQKIVQALQANESLALDALYLHTGLTGSATAAALLNLELRNIVGMMPGKRYKLI